MAQLGLYRKVVLNSAGEPVSGASVEIRRQGATVLGSHATVTTINVNDPGRIIASDTVNYNADAGTNRSVSSVTESTVIVGLAIAVSLADDDRITVVTPLPTLYNDAQGAETKSNPLTTDSNGAVYCYLPGGKYDVKISGSGITTQLLADESVEGAENVVSSLHPSATGTASAFIFDTARSLSAGDNIISVRHTGSEVAFLSRAGNFMSTGSATVGGICMLGSTLSVSSGAQITGSLSAAGAVAFTSTLNVQGAATFNSSVAVSTTGTMGSLNVGGTARVKSISFGVGIDITGATLFDASLGSHLFHANASVTTISMMTGGFGGQLVYVHANDTFTHYENSVSMLLQGSTDFNPGTKGTVTGFLCTNALGNFWKEVSRSVK